MNFGYSPTRISPSKLFLIFCALGARSQRLEKTVMLLPWHSIRLWLKCRFSLHAETCVLSGYILCAVHSSLQ